MFTKIINYCTIYSYRSILASVLFLFTVSAMQGYMFYWVWDVEIYLNVVQVMFHDGVLYKDAIDTKNIGFFFFYYFMYFPYALLFDTMEYFGIWHGFNLTILYLGILYLVYNITLIYSEDKMCSFLITLMINLFIFGNAHSLFINQPQVAVFFCMLFMYYLYKTHNRQNNLDYFIYGILLALTFATSHIYAPLVLIVPFLAIQKNKNITSVILSSSIAGIGFFSIIGLFVLYLYRTDALVDWFYWALDYPTNVYTKTNVLYLFDMRIPVTSSIIKILLTIISLFGVGTSIQFPLMYNVFAHYLIIIFCLLTCVYFVKHIKKYSLSSFEQSICFFSLLVFISRLLITRLGGSDSYNLYLIPMIVGMSAIFYRLYPKFQQRFRKVIFVSLLICLTYIPFRYFVVPLREIPYKDYMVQLTKLNPDKEPTVMVAPWHTSLYSTKWKPLFYTLNSIGDYDFYKKINSLNPELVYVQKDTSSEKHLDGYHRVSDGIYIKNDKLQTWILPQ